MCRALTQTFNCSDKRFGSGGSGKWGEWEVGEVGRGEREEGGRGVSTILAGRVTTCSRLWLLRYSFLAHIIYMH